MPEDSRFNSASRLPGEKYQPAYAIVVALGFSSPEQTGDDTMMCWFHDEKHISATDDHSSSHFIL
jgi:hypothetical protein